MGSYHGTEIDVNTLCKRLKRAVRYLSRNQMTYAQDLLTTCVSNLSTINSAVQAADDQTDLSSDPALAIHDDIDPAGGDP